MTRWPTPSTSWYPIAERLHLATYAAEIRSARIRLLVDTGDWVAAGRILERHRQSYGPRELDACLAHATISLGLGDLDAAGRRIRDARRIAQGMQGGVLCAISEVEAELLLAQGDPGWGGVRRGCGVALDPHRI